ncbi:MAG: tripartite tricarboxylate transporter TctB family protein [Betaproteobacteria bacterium]|nr:tripartite tricarboxylate transporter TctB family protein [Betaproteobacteria bacterium]
MKIRNPKDFWAGLIFIAIGAGAAIIARDYPMGTIARMGAGYFPFVLGTLLALVGVIITLMALGADGEPVGAFALRPLFVILGAVVVFGVIVKTLGMVISLALLVIGTAFGGHEFKLKEVLILAVVMAAFCTLVFIKGLGLPFPVWPAFGQ